MKATDFVLKLKEQTATIKKKDKEIEKLKANSTECSNCVGSEFTPHNNYEELEAEYKRMLKSNEKLKEERNALKERYDMSHDIREARDDELKKLKTKLETKQEKLDASNKRVSAYKIEARENKELANKLNDTLNVIEKRNAEGLAKLHKDSEKAVDDYYEEMMAIRKEEKRRLFILFGLSVALLITFVTYLTLKYAF